MIPDTLTPDVVQSMFNASYFRRGQEYHEDGRVLIIDIRSKQYKQWTVVSQVQGSDPFGYRVETLIEQTGDHFGVRGECGCPISINCKHVVATLLTVIAEAETLVEEIDFQQLRRNLQSNTTHSGSESFQVDSWLRDVRNLQNDPISVTHPAQDPEGFKVFYELSQPNHSDNAGILCKPLLLKMLKSGERSKFAKKNTLSESNRHFLSNEDRLLIGRILVEHPLGRRSTYDGKTELFEESGEMLLKDLLKTGKCFWTDSSHEITEGRPRALSFHWSTSPDGTQQLQHDQGNGLLLFCIKDIWYVDMTTHEMGRVDTNISSALARKLINAPTIPPEKALEARRSLQDRIPENLLPTAYKIRTAPADTQPIPCLHLAERAVLIPDGLRSNKVEKLPVATVSFQYGVAQIPWEETRETLRAFVGETLENYKRNFPAEETALRDLTQNHHLVLATSKDLFPKGGSAGRFFLEPDQDPVAFTHDALPELRRKGWQIEIDSHYPWDVIDVSADHMDQWYANLEEEEGGVDWFGLELGILLPSGEKINLLPILQKYLRNPPKDPSEKKMLAHLDDGKKISFPIERIHNAANTLIDILSRSKKPVDRLRLSRLEAMRLAQLQNALDATALRWQGGQKIRETAEKLSNLARLEEVPLPNLFHGQLRSYQQTGLNWLQFLREYQFSGILSDEMGLGKTIQAIAHISVEKHAGRLQSPVLIVAPTSLMFNWQAELQRFSPDLSVLLLHGNQRRQHHGQINEYDVVLTTYPLLARDKEVLFQHEFHLLILDEAQAIKNAQSQAAQIVVQMRAKHRLCMTGTPMENHLGELWSLFHFMMPGFLGTEKQFKTLFRVPIEKNQDENRRKQLARMVSPFLLRRKKTDVVKELPDKTEILQTVEMDLEQRDLYETIRLAMHKKLHESIKKMGLARSHIMILDALLKLRQICCDPRLLKEGKKTHNLSSAKLAFLMSILPEMVAEGRRILLFSQFTEMLKLIEKELDAIQIPYVVLTGQTRDRSKPVEDFQSGKIPVFLISLKAGGTGLNLTAADTVIHYDPWWNPAAENQATDRAHRMGQEKKVFVYRLVTQGTVEEKIVELQQRKHVLAESLLNDDAETGSAFSMDDLKLLLEPEE